MKTISIIAATLLAILTIGGLDRIEAAEKGKTASAKTEVYKVEELYAKKEELNGKKVTVKGKVVKFSAGIMGKNWIHLQDGSGKQGTNDITITTDQNTSIGENITVTGNLVTNKDFGAGYKYEAIIEEATVKAEK
ncbi:MAG: hypothetical protein AABY54_03780 [Deltaproteobacteria bacterium]